MAMTYLSDLVLPNIRPLSETTAVAVGGVGGSGTRVVARVLQKIGFDMGSDLNDSLDDLGFTALFKRPALWPLGQHTGDLVAALEIYLTGRGVVTPHTISLMQHQERTQQLLKQIGGEIAWLEEGSLADRAPHLCSIGGTTELWGWKEPNTHVVLPFLLTALPNLSYIHVIRHGVDMAFSSNQTQVQLWGQALGNGCLEDAPAHRSVSYWCSAHRRMVELSRLHPGRIYLLRLESLFESQRHLAKDLSEFLHRPELATDLEQAFGEIERPPTLGRHKTKETLKLSQENRATLESLGYSYP